MVVWWESVEFVAEVKELLYVFQIAVNTNHDPCSSSDLVHLGNFAVRKSAWLLTPQRMGVVVANR